ncbi:4'-phosphopantetheinyl transferase superfamily protein [Streptomyces sp. HNM0663]|uniref:4'-phosphopantetheinyl transferase superfamily protein n=1 Tax=Streptomyces chengmaiensis TaxID=3040919 RepID=A0ABT6HJ21_9ACTN|nr:4'-phosphopantetheinyl transferase superfamily protein [Streptomyces chengmaiensis]MDH2388059.1 4'-phosphopantetheinyl transferase superfamily protein [Streptomyces chengmaiensis]
MTGISIGPLPPPHPAAHSSGTDGSDHGWRYVRGRVLRDGHAVCHGLLTDWAAAPGTPARELSGADWARYRSAREPAVRGRLFGSRLLARHAVAAAADADPSLVELVRGAGGRPAVCAPAGFDVGISHTGDLLVVGVARGRRIGVDAEHRDRPLSMPPLPEKFCHPEELARLARLPAAERNRALVHRWTLKEAYAKALGVGLRLDLSGVPFVACGAARGDGRRWRSPAAPGWCFVSGTAARRFVVACAVGPAGPRTPPPRGGGAGETGAELRDRDVSIRH